MEENRSKVYVLLDGDKIIRCEGGYTMQNIEDISQWIFIDEGTGDRYNLCQSHYFDGGLHTEDGICRYKYVNGECILRPDVEIEEERVPILKNRRIAELKAELAVYDYIGVKIATGVATQEEYADQIACCETLRKQIRALEE